jgi:hypothetical protein
MDAMMAESTQQALIPGKCVDLYYPDPETAEKQCFRTSINTKFTQQFANLGGGVSVFTIPPQNGVQDVILTFQLPAGTSTGLAVPRGWGYALIKQISYRIGGSSQYFMTGAQMLQAALRNCPNAQARDDLYSLGGSYLSAATTPLVGAAGNYAYVWLQLPFTTPSASGKKVPLPTDLLTQQVQITIELNPLSSIYSVNGGTIPGGGALASAEFQVQQVALANQGDALARRVDMTTHSLSYPCEFVQQELAVNLANTAAVQTISLTGFRSGEVKSIQVWLTKDSDDVATGRNPLKWYAPLDLQLTYAGDVYSRFSSGSSALWNLVNSRMTPRVAAVSINFAGGAYVPSASDFAWAELPFGQAYVPETAHSVYLAGKEITNGIVQLQLRTPSAAADWVLHASYVYNSVIVFSQGTADFAF